MSLKRSILAFQPAPFSTFLSLVGDRRSSGAVIRWWRVKPCPRGHLPSTTTCRSLAVPTWWCPEGPQLCWWCRLGSNQRVPRYERGALPTELLHRRHKLRAAPYSVSETAGDNPHGRSSRSAPRAEDQSTHRTETRVARCASRRSCYFSASLTLLEKLVGRTGYDPV
jgi:hypothetical protein